MNYRTNSQEDQIAAMKRLINYGNVNETVDTGALKPVLEYSTVAADGKTYGIIRENHKFYIKVAPQKNTELLAEDYDYIGGFNNKKQHEYNSYVNASKHFDLKMMALNEAYANKKPIVECAQTKPAEWQVQETKEMRNELNRFHQIINNTAIIMNESVGGDPFTKKETADPEFDGKKGKDPKKAGEVKTDGVNDEGYEKEPTTPEGTEKSDTEKNNIKGDNKPVVKNQPKNQTVKEGKKGRILKLTESQVLAWNKSMDYMDKSHGTEIGDTAPYDEKPEGESNEMKVQEEKAVYNTDNQNYPAPHVGEVGDEAPFDENVNEGVYDYDYGDTDDEFDILDNEPDDESYEWEEEDTFDDDFYYGEDGEEIEDEDEDIKGYKYNLDSQEDIDSVNRFLADPKNQLPDDINLDFDDNEEVSIRNAAGFDGLESKSHKNRRSIKETRLNDFGKHPAYRKVPFTTPANTETAPNGAKEWDDESVKGEKPFGSQIGSSAPFSEKVIDQLADAVMQKLGFQNKA